MRKIIVLSFISLDGVMQAPGGPQEDTSGGFKFGGWTAPYFDEEAGKLMDQQMQQSDYLFGRKTFDIFESYWPLPEHAKDWPGVNAGTKYVLSTTRSESSWHDTVFLADIDALTDLKQTDGPDLQVHGSSELVHALLEHDLIDELWLKTFPVVLGRGKRLFTESAVPAAYELTESHVLPSGVVFANYWRAGDIQIGSFD